MMKNVRYILTGLCILATIFCVCQYNIYAEEIVTGFCGDSTFFEMNYDTGTLRIGGTGEMDEDFIDDYITDEEEYLNKITTLVIEDGVTNVSNCAFAGCTSLKTISIAKSVKKIGEEAFEDTAFYNDVNNWEEGVLYIDDCLIKANAEFVDEKYKIKSGTRIIADDAFMDCEKIEKIIMPKSVEIIGEYAFGYCSKLDIVKLKNADSITHIHEGAFYNSSLDEFTLGKNVELIGDYAFACSKIISIGGTNIEDYSQKQINKLLKRNFLWGIDLYVYKDNEYAINHLNKLRRKSYEIYPEVEGPIVKVSASNNKISIKFTKNNNAKKYCIEVKNGSTKKTFSTKKLKYSIGSKKMKLAKGKTYEIRVRVKMKNDQYTKYSKVKKVKAK